MGNLCSSSPNKGDTDNSVDPRGKQKNSPKGEMPDVSKNKSPRLEEKDLKQPLLHEDHEPPKPKESDSSSEDEDEAEKKRQEAD